MNKATRYGYARLMAHLPHCGVRSGDPELLEHLGVSLDELLHRRLHMVVCDQSQLTHLAGLETGIEGLRKDVIRIFDFRNN